MGNFFLLSQRLAASLFGCGQAHRSSGFGYANFIIHKPLWGIIGLLCCFPSVHGEAFDERWRKAKRFRVVLDFESNVRRRGEIQWADCPFVR